LPAAGAQVVSPFEIEASAQSCGTQTVASMSYSVDSGTSTTETSPFTTLQVAGDGAHVLHVTCTGASGATESQDVNITVVASTDPPASSYATTGIQALTSWKYNHDPGTPGTSTGTSAVVSSPSLSGKARQFTMSYTGSGGEIFSASWADDTSATHFIYSDDVYIVSATDVANIEMDMNQVLADGTTVIYAVQCDGYSGTWDISENTGTATNYVVHWAHSNVACPAPKTWAANTWHRVQIAYERDNSGNVTYQSVVLDGVEHDFTNSTLFADFALGWGKVLLTNFQLDGLGTSGSAQVYADNMTVYKW
jgi:hypothetical protein